MARPWRAGACQARARARTVPLKACGPGEGKDARAARPGRRLPHADRFSAAEAARHGVLVASPWPARPTPRLVRETETALRKVVGRLIPGSRLEGKLGCANESPYRVPSEPDLPRPPAPVQPLQRRRRGTCAVRRRRCCATSRAGGLMPRRGASARWRRRQRPAPNGGEPHTSLPQAIGQNRSACRRPSAPRSRMRWPPGQAAASGPGSHPASGQVPGIQSVPASGTRAIAAASTVSATRSSRSR